MVEVYVGLKQTYKLQIVPQVGKIFHFAKCLEFATFKADGKCWDWSVSLKLDRLDR